MRQVVVPFGDADLEAAACRGAFLLSLNDFVVVASRR